MSVSVNVDAQPKIACVINVTPQQLVEAAKKLESKVHLAHMGSEIFLESAPGIILRYDPEIVSPYSEKLKKKMYVGSIDDTATSI